MPVNNDIKERLIRLLRTIFQLENEELDFGIYKILNHKKKEIESFIQKDLIEEINKQLQLVSIEEQKKRTEELEQLKQQLIDLGVEDYENNAKYQEKKKQLENIKVSKDLEKEIYNNIHTFFSRYYDKGDFISKRKYGKTNKYALPYSGEETLLHWANNDQYYIKTTESFKRYDFKTPRLTVSFRIVQAEEEKANVKAKEKKFFITSQEKVSDYENKTLNIYFDFRALTDAESKKYPRPTQEQINQDNINTIRKALDRDEKAADLFKEDETGKTLIEKQLNKYTRKNTSDYFVHRDLKSFLDRELDFYIKNEVVDLSDVTKLDLEQFNKYILEIKVIRNISTKIINFLAQIEDFQKKLWEKKKFVLRTEFVITTDLVPEIFYGEVWGNENQKKEWIELGFDIPKSKKELKSKTIPIDTKNFSQEFKEKLIEKLSEGGDLDELFNGSLVKSENWQALNLLLEKYRDRIHCIYIDPPYNTGSDDFLYKDKYRHSSWLSMMYYTLRKAKLFLLNNIGTIWINMDDNEIHNASLLLNNIFGEDAFVGNVAWKKTTGDNKPIFAFTHDNVIIYGKDSNSVPRRAKLTKKERKAYSNPDNDPRGDWAQGDYRSKWTKAERPNLYYAIIHPKTGEKISPDTYSSSPRVWGCSEEQHFKNVEENLVWWGIDGELKEPKKKRFLKDHLGINIRSVWEDAGSNDDASLLLRDIFGIAKIYPTPKPLSLIQKIMRYSVFDGENIFDFFAGSGTTAQAVMELNKEDGGKRKYILVEMGDYFDNIIVPRLKKICYSTNWKNGKPQDEDGISQFFKYQAIEQYEDTLENIELSQMTLEEFKDYFVKYMLDFESRDSKTFLNIDAMKDPFNYKLRILDNYEPKTVSVDLVETYNYLIGLHVSKINGIENKDDKKRKYMVVKGKRGGRSAIVIWRNTKDLDPQKDKEFITNNILDTHYDEVHINGDNLIENSVLIEEQFKRLMNSS